MSARYYRLGLVLAASISLLAAGCGGGERPTDASIPIAPAKNAPPPPPKAVAEDDDIDTESTIFTVLGLAKKPSKLRQGPQTGAEVSPSLWVASHDALNFVGVASEDPIAGFMVTEWYSPARKPNERLRVTVFILSRALRSDSLAVTVDREERSAAGWKATPVAQEVVTDIETAILQRARQIHAEVYRKTL